MKYNLIINQILVLFIIIGVGFILRKKNFINKEINKGLSNLLMDITLPALIISSLAIKINHRLIHNIKLITILSIIIYLAVIFFTKIIVNHLSLSSEKKTVFRFLIVFGNVGYMGYPILNAIYPKYGIFYGVFNNLVFNILIWTFGIYIFTKDQSNNKIQWNKLFNNGIIAIVIGIILLLTDYKLPKPISEAIEIIGNMTFPLSMLVIGYSIGEVKIINMFKNKHLILLSFLKLLFIPFIIYISLNLFQFPPIITTISIILFAMPAAASGVIFAERFEGDYKFAAEGIILTVLLSLFTIPLFISIINFF